MKKSIKGLGLVLMGAILMLGVVVYSPLFNGEDSEQEKVYAMMESNASEEEKMIYLEKRVTSEMSRLSILMGYSDLCSNKYINELDTLRLSIDSTVKGYEKIEASVSKSEIIKSKYEDYKKLSKKYDEMVVNIEKTEYTKALENLSEIKELKSKEYVGIESEITKLGSN